MGDGYLGKCKDCTRKDTADRVERLSKDPEWVEKELDRHRIKARQYRETGKAFISSAQEKQEVQKRYRSKYPEKSRANRITRAAILSGTLIPQPCQSCGTNEKIQAHHDDYSKPLDVMWFCPKHHAERHVTMRRKERLKQII